MSADAKSGSVGGKSGSVDEGAGGDDAEGDYFYEVSDEMLERFRTSTVAQRLAWLDEMRTFSWNLLTPDARTHRRKLRDARRGL